jgi:hypothetical protein
MFTVFRLLPEQPDLDQFRNEAELLLCACHTGDADALSRFDHWLLRGKSFDPLTVKLSDAQVVVAQEHGCRSWPQFVELIRDKSNEGRDPESFRQARDAIRSDAFELLLVLLQQHPKLAQTRSLEADEARQTLLHYAAGHGTVEMAQALVAAGARLDALTLPFDMTPLAGALYEGNTEVALYLAARAEPPFNFSIAAGLGRLDQLQTLIGDRDELPPYLEPDVYDPMRSLASAFRYACGNGQLAVVKYLLELGLDVNVRLQDGATGMHLAAYLGHRELVQFLLEQGADKTAHDQKFDGSPAGWAATFGHREIATLIAAY